MIYLTCTMLRTRKLTNPIRFAPKLRGAHTRSTCRHLYRPMFLESLKRPADEKDAPETSDRERIEALFRSLDINGDGRVDVKEIARKLNELAERHRKRPKTTESDGDADRVLEIARDLVENAKRSKWSWSRDREPALGLQEFSDFLLSKERSLKQLFESIDLDKDQHITSEELSQWLQSANIHLTPEQARKLVKRMDLDANEKIEWEEFRDFVVFIPQSRGTAPSQRELVIFHSTLFGQIAAGDQFEMGYALPKASALSSGKTVQYILCGGLSAAVSRTATAPLDRLRVYFQNKTSRLKLLPRPQSAGARAGFGQEFMLAVKEIYANGGLRSFWRGNSLELIKMIPGSAFQFTFFEISKSLIATYVEGKTDRSRISDTGRFAAGGLAGATAMVAGFPISTVKTRVMSQIVMDRSLPNAGQPATEGRHIALRTASDMWRAGGVRAFYKGLPVALLGIVPYSGTNLALFELLRREYVDRFNRTPSNVTVLREFDLPCSTANCVSNASP